MKLQLKELQKAAHKLADELDADIIFYNGVIEDPWDLTFMDKCHADRQRKNVILILCTYGGDASAAYRIARCLQGSYEKFIVWIAGSCKSAGTLLALGASELVMSDHAELGPLDVQMGKKDELFETDSGLTVMSAIETVEEKCFELFEDCFLKLKSRSSGQISLRTASEMASKLAIGILSPIVAQIDPMHIGEASRAMEIGRAYGARLADKSKNAFENTVDHLTDHYPSHGFVIDRDEASSLFNKVRKPTDRETELINLLGAGARTPNPDTPIIIYLSAEAKDEIRGQTNDSASKGTGETGVPRTPDAGGEATQVADLKRAAASGAPQV
jgi:hypothetical protein